jgi:hypothetical protein
VRFRRGSLDDRYLSYWLAPLIASYTAGDSVAGGDFDVANVDLLSPSSGATVSFPATFAWQPRGIAGDSYALQIYDTDSDTWWRSEDLGAVGSFELTSLPSGFVYGEPYRWIVLVSGPDGSGASHYFRDVTFAPSASDTPTPTPTRTPTAPAGIFGTVTFRGTGAAGIELELRHWDGHEWSTASTGFTDGEGRYSFTGLPSLGLNQAYYVRFRRGSLDDRYLSYWLAPLIGSYTAGDSVAGGDFDVANVELVSPAYGATVSLPATFAWQPRGIATDSYRLYLYDPYGETNWLSPDLGATDSFELTSLPTGFAYGNPYRWYIRVYNGPDSYGVTHYYRQVTFAP